MKTTFLKISVFILLFSFLGAGCKKEDEEDLSYLDYSKALSTPPAFAIYKTKKDYFFNVSVNPMQNNYIMSPELKEGGSGITLYKGKYYYTERYRLNDNYIASFAVESDSYFTSLSYDEYIRENLAPVVGVINPKVLNGIIDRDPFTEFYYTSSYYIGFTIDELNQLIKEKKLEKYFTKIK